MSEQSGSADTRSLGQRAKSLAIRVGIALLIVALVFGLYALGAAFLPRWWAQQIGHRVDGSFSGGIGIGVTVGFVSTFVPIVLIVFAIIWRRRWKNVPAIACGIAAVITVLPNLLTLTVVFGTGSGAHAGERIMDVDAPAFRGASLGGAIAGALLALVVSYFVLGYRRRGRKLHDVKLQEIAEHPEPDPAE